MKEESERIVDAQEAVCLAEYGGFKAALRHSTRSPESQVTEGVSIDDSATWCSTQLRPTSAALTYFDVSYLRFFGLN